MSVAGAVIIFFRHLRHRDFRRLNYDCWSLSCGLSCWSYGFRRYSCCPSCGLSLKRNCCLCCSCLKTSFSKRRNCFCCSCHSKKSCLCCRNRLKSLSCCPCYSCRCWNSKRKNFLKRMSSADARIRNWNATGGCCWARCSFDARCFGCQCGRYLNWQGVAELHCCWCGRWYLSRDG